MNKNMKYHCGLLVVAVIAFFSLTSVNASDNFVKISLPKGVSIELPKNWIVLSNDLRITIDTMVDSGLDLAGIEYENTDLPFAANYFKNGETVGIINIRYYSNLDFTQNDSRQATLQDINALNATLKESIVKSMTAAGMSVLSWTGTKKRTINGITVFVTEYRRKSIKGIEAFRVRLIRVLAGDRSFTLTVSYAEEESASLKPITDRIINSLKLSGIEEENQGFDISTARPVEEMNQGFDPTRSVPVEGTVEANPFDQFDTPEEKDPLAGLDPRFDNASTPIDKDPFARFVTPQDQLSRDRPEKSNTGSLVSQFWGAICAWLALSAVYTWGIGLTPPLLIRFLIVRRPINKWWAIGTAVGFFFINTILFIILNKVIADAVGSLPRMHNPMAMILIAFVSYLILRKKLRYKSQRGKKSKEKVIKTKLEAEDYVVSSKLPVISKSKQGSMGAEVSPCPKCSQLNTSRRTTCKYCGAVLEGYCPECKEPIRPGESYCSKCYPNKEIDTVKSNSTGGDQKGDTSNNTEVGFVNEKIVRYISIGIGVLITFIILHIYNESFVDGGLFAWYIQDTMVFELLRGFTHEIDYRNDEEIAYFLWFVCFGGGVFLSWKYRVKTAGVLIKMIKALHEKA